ncbi:PREDICTED: E3 ubiquitin/ISG15 ligase TRIM25-like [Pterocles gutturalis]|uniref:E3 ubiquitin/ISG15 ligase TRIM25-like n=1 Tax=Pterocles gutturalis TaxID=240206 RepID=UPI0005282377|nr:PREDICTED: E3 ubiquitin/ISG15 ligase TRIM25-like [Pterocles gutturalis]
MAELQEELTCPICLDIYSNAVSLGCGHSFCEGCIREARSHQPNLGGPFRCPQCCTPAEPAAQLQPNAQLHSMVREFLDASAHQEQDKHPGVQCEKKGEDLGQQEEVIPCDFCLQEPQPAVKTCLSCEAALCQAHLSKHSLKRHLKDHVLIEPCGAGVLAERRCPQHGKLLDIYCKTDSVCICLLCFLAGSHKNHQIITLGQAFGQAQTKERLKRDQLENLFEELHLQLDNKKGEVLKALSDSMEQELSQIQTQIQEHKEHKDAASHDVQELKALRDQKDPILFTKAFTAIHAR